MNKNPKNIPFAIFLFFITCRVYAFIPSQETCGAKIKASGKEGFPDNINAALMCMDAGFRNLYKGSASELNSVEEELKPSIRKYVTIQIPASKYLPIHSDLDQQIIIFNEKGNLHASFLYFLATNAINNFDRNISELEFVKMLHSEGGIASTSGLDYINNNTEASSKAFKKAYEIFSHYENKAETPALYGILFGYDEEDVKYFYQTCGSKQFDTDHRNAVTFISENTEKFTASFGRVSCEKL